MRIILCVETMLNEFIYSGNNGFELTNTPLEFLMTPALNASFVLGGWCFVMAPTVTWRHISSASIHCYAIFFLCIDVRAKLKQLLFLGLKREFRVGL